MTDTVEFELVAPERLLLSAPVSMVVVPGAEGDFAAMPGHAAFISGIRTGIIDVYENSTDVIDRRIFVSGGFAEVTPERCTVLADEAVALDGADRTAADQRLKAAQEALGDANSDDARDAAAAEIAIAEALLAAIDASARN
jgi:F-type H+-transporting ATPase subunit epsilon